MRQTRYLFNADLTETQLAHYFAPHYWQQRQKILGAAKGRGTTYFLDSCEELGKRAALRHYYRGGLFGKFVKDHFFFSRFSVCRSFAEFTLLQQLKQQGLPVPTPIAARVTRCGFCYQADILIELIENGRDLVAILQENRLSDDLWRQIGKLIRQLHNRQVFHSDLNAHNILLQTIENKQPKLWLLDFDKCGFRAGNAWKAANLQRLYRSFQKERERCRMQFNEQNWQALLAGYEEN